MTDPPTEGPVSLGPRSLPPTGMTLPAPPPGSFYTRVPGLWVLRHYRAAYLRDDVVAGLVLTALLVPAGMAYAEAAGLPAVTGIQLRREKVTARGVEYEPDSARLGDGGPNLRTWNYTSTLLVSDQHFQYGVFEARIKLPTGKGAWPSFWLFGGNPNEEIDILEGKGERRNRFHVDVHCPGDACDNYRNPIGAFGRWLGINWKGFGHWKTVDGDLTSSFNDYVGEWTPDALRFYFNDEQCAEWVGELHVPERLMLQNALANTCKGCPFGPGPDDTTTFGEMVVDHVRVWRLMAKDDPALTMISAQGLPRDLTAEVRTSIAEAPQALRPKGGKRGKVLDVLRVKTLHDIGKRAVLNNLSFR